MTAASSWMPVVIAEIVDIKPGSKIIRVHYCR